MKSAFIKVLYILLTCAALAHVCLAQLPSGWLDGDVGTVGTAGTTTFANGTFTVQGAGSQIYGTADAFHFAYQQLSGDGSIVARVGSVTGGASYAAAGVMVRETLDQGAANAKAADWPSYNAIYFDFRGSTGGGTSEPGYASASLPYWVKLVRSGNIFSSYVSQNGQSWTQLGSSQTISMAQDVYIGLAVTSGTTSALATATFDNVSISSTSAPAPVISSTSATTGAVGKQVTITGNTFGAAQGGSQVILNGAPMAVNSWSSTSIVFTISAGATSGFLSVSVAPSMNASNPVYFAVTSQPIPAGWLDLDIGATAVQGTATYSGGRFTVQGAGTQIYGTADAFHFAYQHLSGDGSIVARIVSVSGGASYAAAGVMVRETLDQGAANAKVADWPTYGSIFFDFRGSTGGSTSEPGYASASLPYWVKLARSGNTFSSYISQNGESWTQLGTSQTISMAQDVYIGLAVTSGTTSALTTAMFDNVSVSSTSVPAPVISSTSATTGSVGNQVQITGSNFGDTSGSLVTLNGVATTLNSWSNTSIVFTIPPGATSGFLVVSVAPSMNDSNPIYFTVESQPLPSGWLDLDIGSTGVAGSASYASGTFAITGAANNISNGGTADAFHFVYQPLAGDGSIVARVASLQGYAQAAVMIRETLDPSSTFVMAYYRPNQAYLYSRATTGAANSVQSNSSFNSPAYPYWVKATRSGSTFTGYASNDGVSWTQIGSTSINMASSVYIGLAVTGGGSSESTAFDSVSVGSSSAPAPVITSVSATTGPVGSQVQITGANFGATNGSVVTLSGVPTTIVFWSNTSIVLTIPTGATSGNLVVSVAPSMNDSNPVYFTVTTNPLPHPWLDAEIGTVYVAGSATYSGGVFTVNGGGGISNGGTADGLHFVYQTLSGDGSIIARLSSLQGSAQYPQVGLMIRETLDQSSRFAFVFYTPNQGYLYSRATTGGSTASQATFLGYPAAPLWMRLIRNGDNFSAYISNDGSTWVQIGTTTTVSMASNVYIGLAVTGGGSGYLETATFDSTSAVLGTTPYVSSVTGSVGGVGDSVTITGSNFGATQGSSQVRFNGAVASSVTSWSDSQIVAVVPSTVPAGTGPLTVVVNSIQSNASVTFTAINPVLTSLSPPAAAAGAQVTVNGSGLTLYPNQTQVYFNGTAAQVRSMSSASIVIWIPQTATTGGPISVTVGNYASNSLQFTLEPPPSITAISPASGAAGSQVHISGAGFGATQSNSSISFYLGVPAQIVSWSDTDIVATVPSGASTGPVGVQVANLSAQGPSFEVTGFARLTDSLGNVTTYSMAVTGGKWTLSNSQGSGCATCSIRGNLQETNDSLGNVLTHTDDLGHVTTYAYDSNNNVASVSQELDANTTATTSYTYNSFGEVLTMTDPLGNVTTNAYDANGNLTSVTTPAPDANTAASVTQFTYDAKGQLSTVTDPLNHVTTLAYTPTGVIQSITDAQNHVTSYTYDARGNRTSVIDPINGSSHPTTFTYDIMNRLTGITYPDGSSVAFGYDYRGRRTSATDQNSKTTTYSYDDADRLISVTDAANNVTQYAYDSEDNLTSIADANNHTTSFAYNAHGWVTQTTFPSTLTESYGYDAVGNLTSKTDRKNQTIHNVYDALYRLTQKNYPDSTNVEYVYDLVGKVKQVTDPTGTYGFAYDNMGRLIGTTTQYAFVSGNPFSNAYTYDAGSNRRSLTAPDGSITTYGYDTLNRLNGMANSWAGSFGFGYDALSRRTSLTRPNGVNTNYSYDSVSHLLSVLHQTGSATLDGASYVYDSAGNRTSKTNYLSNITEGYSYDPIYELIQVVQGATTIESYLYDGVGNRLSSSGVPTYNYNSSNELTSNSNGSYIYDANGNTLSDPSGKSYTWDFENRLVSAVVSGTGGGTTTFKYDPFGRRIQKSGPLGTTNYLYDGSRLIAELDGLGNILARYAHSEMIDEPLSVQRSGAASYYENDAIGSITSLSSSTATLADTYTFDAFGKLNGSTGTITNPFRYTARESDPETGLYYYRARYFDPASGRFINEDPLRFGGDGPDFYAYVNNDPTNFVDPLGLKCCDIPAHPPGVSIEANTAQAQTNGYRWWFNTVGQWGGPWDYKNWNHEHHPEWDEFGNFNAGATACALHIPLWITLRGAGWAKWNRTPNDPWGNPLWKWPYGNQDEKQRQVMAGWEWCKDGCAQPNPQVGAAPLPGPSISLPIDGGGSIPIEW